MADRYRKVAQFKNVQQFRDQLTNLDLDLPVDDEILTREQSSPLAQPIAIGNLIAGNRWCVHPMEGWDANRDGSPSPTTLRRWRHFGLSGAKIIWGGEAAAVQPDGRANPNQTLAITANRQGLAELRSTLLEAHRERFGQNACDDLLVGLQLTHSGRFCRPDDQQLKPRIAYHHPLLDTKFGIDSEDNSIVWSDDDLERLINNYVTAAGLAYDVGYQFVDIKSCHGYLLHEFLSARRRLGRFGGDYQGRTRLLKTIIGRIHDQFPELTVVVRLSVFDFVPFKTSREVGEPLDYKSLLPYELGFGVNSDDPLEMDLTEPIELMGELQAAGVAAINVSCGSPYYNPHIQRPAIFPPSDGYQPPEDPLLSVARQIIATRKCKQALPDLPLVGSGYSYLQDYLVHVAQAVVREGWVDIVGYGRMVLSYPELAADTLTDGKLSRKKVCRTFSDCTTAPRNHMISGCFPLDPYYKSLSEYDQLQKLKKETSE